MRTSSISLFATSQRTLRKQGTSRELQDHGKLRLARNLSRNSRALCGQIHREWAILSPNRDKNSQIFELTNQGLRNDIVIRS
jgi:hypothetical protein